MCFLDGRTSDDQRIARAHSCDSGCSSEIVLAFRVDSEGAGSKRVLTDASLAVLREQTAAQHKRSLYSFTGHSRQPGASFHQQNDYSIHPSVSTLLSLNATIAS
jgi:hypothetical protein